MRHETGRPARRAVLRLRIAVACAIGLVAGVASWGATKTPGFGLQDFQAWWLAGRAIIDGLDPYVVVRRTFTFGFVYPLPTALAVVPLVWLPPTVAAGVFVGISSAVLAFVCTREAWWPLLIFLSGSAVESIVMGHWSLLLAAACFAPALTWIAVFKPNVGLALFARRPSYGTAVVVVLIMAASLWVQPTWPRDLLNSIHNSLGHPAPWRTPGGLLLLAAVVRWRRPEARFLTVFALVPSSPIPYEALPLLALAATRLELILLGVCSDLAFLAIDRWGNTHDALQYFSIAPKIMLWLMYVPTLIIILRRPNEGILSPRVERLVTRLPSWVRGAVPREASEWRPSPATVEISRPRPTT